MNPQLAFLLDKALESLRNSNSESAELYLKQAIKIQASNPHVLRLLGVIYAQRKQYQEALKYINDSLKSLPKNALTLSNLGNIFLELKEFQNALDAYDKSIRIDPKYDEVWSNKANALFELKRYDEAITCYDKALSLKPDYAEGWSNKGNLLKELKRYNEALIHFDQALSLKPDYAEGWSNKGATLNELKRYDEALAHYDKALSLKPDYVEVWSNKGEALNSLKRHSESAQCYLKALELKTGESYFLGESHHQMMLACDWTNYEKMVTEIFNLTHEGRMGSEPFGFQGIANSEALLKKCAEIYSNDKYPVLGNLTEHTKYQHHKIRIGYLCGEFRNQATSILMAGVWELHDQSKFEIFAFDNGYDDGSEYRHRIESAFGNLFDISKLSDLNVAKLIQAHEIDILVNLNGFFGLPRQGVFSYKPAPIQVNYLGFPGTLGANYMDYMIADKVVLPDESKKYYVEKIVHLPNSYQANDNRREISARQFIKTELGLPESGFIFACFNNNYKITPSTFDSWMRILTHVPRSVLWLLADNPIAKENLLQAAVSRGIDSSRLIFAERLPLSEHLARHNLADLFLDTLPYNAHTTCSDALWAGLPVLTLLGNTFPGRVAASLLHALGLDELITFSKEEYEAMAMELATNPEKLASVKQKLAENRTIAPLFDTPAFTKHLEAAYMQMYDRYTADLHPEHITII
ncbi:MAG: tetratricopeptide repeat protein [Burkholderiaceae bacterium]